MDSRSINERYAEIAAELIDKEKALWEIIDRYGTDWAYTDLDLEKKADEAEDAAEALEDAEEAEE